ncbi:hypothetical protein [Pedobacter gandavensis]|uniref:hypothetical protein n=1 Tax=Pedobacter gandavensis TaxID=2679963 RepID=UPI00292EF04B|nr:hypothetical protein [Pedobacter gandavensis]
MLKKFRNDKYKNDLTTHVGDFLESLLNDVPISAIGGNDFLPISGTGSGLKDCSAVMGSTHDQANPHKA